jgi:hypothetical protein
MFFLKNLEKELKNIKKEIIHDCVKSLVNINYETGNNYHISTKHSDKLYSLFIESCRKNLNNDLLVFPGFLNHLPIVHKTKKRISLQFEISCIEDINDIWLKK